MQFIGRVACKALRGKPGRAGGAAIPAAQMAFFLTDIAQKNSYLRRRSTPKLLHRSKLKY